MTKQQPQIKVHHILLSASQLATLLSQQKICTKHPNPNQMAILLINSRIGKKKGEKNWLNFNQVYQTLKPCFSQLKISQQIRIRKIRE